MLFAVAVALSGCGGGGGGGGGGGPTTGSLQITVSGLPGGVNASVLVAGSGGFAQTVTASGTLSGLVPGTYVVGASDIVNVGTPYVPIISGSPVSVTAGATANVTVTYSAGTAGSDPLYANQWHLANTGQGGGTPGEDVNVTPVWGASIKGQGIRIAVVDDGLEIAHEDLSPNVVAGQSHDYVDGDTDPNSGQHDHGTAVAGVAAARDLNSLGGRGAAPRASLVGYNLLQTSLASNEADAMTRNAAAVHVSNNSWGPPDGNGTFDASSTLWRGAINTGLSSGRGGLGTIYAWAAGNGGDAFFNGFPGLIDNSNYDGYANYRGVIAICAVGDDGVKASYSERGANLWVCAPSQGQSGQAITTADRSGALGYNFGAAPDYPNPNYTNTFNGTSSAAPLAAGVIALVLEANPTLTWRDLRLILAATARQNDPFDLDWDTNGAGYNINHKYGFGVIDADAAVTLAQSWINVGALITFPSTTDNANVAIPDDTSTGVSRTITVSGSGIGNIEFVEITLNSNHTFAGDLDITLTSPSGTVSQLTETHTCAASCTLPGNTWTFGSARHLDEVADGDWTLTVKDLAAVDTGTLQSWNLTFHGRAP
jgi:kexin